MNRAEAHRHAETWISAWNRKDLDAVMAGFVEDAVFISPRALELTGSAEIRGRDALHAYWATAMERVESFAFRLERALWDEQAGELVIIYISVRNGIARRAAELSRFDAEGRKLSGEAFYGAPAV